ncbi:TRAP transporter large permease [Oceanisphaera psychrotolerans]|uniref:TRAP transporter large permease protein n=1 Tax=Oceanisphaera psychrotolerans TaxID=1414654 RepID=A0A1J4QEX5_9GAMM|nr:TRAP transporter large permease [Oceanisphaera psychrotolerans]OIN08932.1 C4-dicarboxylate ABC transporter permease [Oceanisphaera psychrotolerans]
MSGIVLFAVLGLLLVLGMPIAMSLGMSSLFVMSYVDGAPPISLMARSIVTGADSFPLIAVPLFILAGDLMQVGGLSKRIINFASSLVGHIRASLCYVNVLASMFFAAISGSAPATVAAIGSNIIPSMNQQGYRKEFSSALTASAGMIGVMIPPSIPFIIYGVSAEVSIGKLFLAGIVPGILFGLVFMFMSRVVVRNQPVMDMEITPFSWKNVAKEFKSSIWALIVPGIILGGIYGGIFTPTEAGAVAVVYAIFCGVFIYKEITLSDLPKVFARSTLTSATILVLVVFAAAFGRLITFEQIPAEVANTLISLSDNPIVILLLINLLLLFVGMFMETISAIIILTPILLPVVIKIGVDPILFGVILTVNLAIGFCTPPLGVNIFVASQISNISIEKISRALIPFLYAMLVLLLVITFVPGISLTLTNFAN